jgi:hydroxymethylglutaryl-CoA reductase
VKDSRLRGLHRLPVAERVAALETAGFLTEADAALLTAGMPLLPVPLADVMIENVIGCFALPLGIAPNFRVDGRDYLVPMAVEEPSIVAASSSAARLARQSGGFVTVRSESLLAGQVHLHGIREPGEAAGRLLASREALLRAGNAAIPRLVARGGGISDLAIRRLTLDQGEAVLVVHLLVDTCDAMGANSVNTLCEALAPELAAISGGRASLKILSNLADRALVVARARFALSALAPDAEAAVLARDGIVLANRLASADPYRAATHNKGIMNGIDALAIATGNDWRAIEAGVHAYAARSGRYSVLTDWTVGPEGDLEGRIELPLKPGIAGGTIAGNPGAALCLRLTAIGSADELASLMAAVGLAQNFAALRALATTGIQAGHMRLHSRSAAAALHRKSHAGTVHSPGQASASGKVILFGEHAVVYGRHALALPIPGAVRAKAARSRQALLEIPEWGTRISLAAGETTELASMVSIIALGLGLPPDVWHIRLETRLPRAMGLGSSAAIAVAITRALVLANGLPVDDARVNDIAFECEKKAHGTPSGVDNTLATYGQPLLFRRGDPVLAERLELAEVPPMVIALSGRPGRTVEQVDAVRERRAAIPERFEAVFDEMDAACLDGRRALAAGDYATVALLMNFSHGLLNAIGVSTPEIEALIGLARNAGAVGAKLTGAGGGGSILALCPGRIAAVAAAFAAAGYRTLSLEDELP